LSITSVVLTHPLGKGVEGRKKGGQSLRSKCHYPPPTFMNSSLKGILESLKASKEEPNFIVGRSIPLHLKFNLSL
jgi:hypothetical protein